MKSQTNSMVGVKGQGHKNKKKTWFPRFSILSDPIYEMQAYGLTSWYDIITGTSLWYRRITSAGQKDYKMQNAMYGIFINPGYIVFVMTA